MNDFKTYDDFCDFVNRISEQPHYDSGFRHPSKFPEIVFGEKNKGGGNNFCHIIHLPRNIVWDWNTHENAHTTWFNTGGGFTGCGSGSQTICCWKDEVHDTILNLPNYIKYVRILRCGMNFAGHEKITPISHFFQDIARWERNENDYWVKGHIIAKPNKPANLHDQDIILNREWWNKLGSPDIFKLKFVDFERADTNFHDDYTPHWLKPKDYPIIRNFPKEERDVKVFSYNRYPNEPVTKKTGIPPRYTLYNDIRNENKFYPVNTENMRSFYNLLQITKKEMNGIDVIVSPTAGFITEFLAKVLDIRHIVYYDITDIHIELKKELVELINSADELEWWVKEWWKKTNIETAGVAVTAANWSKPDVMVKTEYWNVNDNEQHELKYGEGGELTIKNGTIDEQLEHLEWARNNCKMDYIKFDLLEDDLEKFSKYIGNKKVLWNTSNIFAFVKTHIVYRLPYIMNRYEYLLNYLNETSKEFIFRGSHLNKVPVLIDRKGYIRNEKGERRK